MKSIFLLFVIAIVSADEFHMQLNENGERFQEDIKIDVAGNTEEIKVPKHQDRAALDLLNDFNVGLSAMKVPDAKTCYISKIDPSEQTPQKMKESMELAHSKFPSERYMVSTYNSLPLRRMTPAEVGEKITAHCKGHALILTVNFNKENIEDEALKIVKSIKTSGKYKRDTSLGKFVTCNIDSMKVVATCPKQKLGAMCVFKRTDQLICAYHVQCDPNPNNGDGPAICRGDHRYNIIHCCDFKCMD